MLGPEGTAELARSWVAAALPARLTLIAGRLALEPAALPAPAAVLAYDKARLAVEEWPAVVVEVEGLRSLELVDVDGIDELYRARYSARVYVWVRGDGYPEVDLIRKRYVLAIRELALANKTLGAYRIVGDVVEAPLAIDPSSLRESLSPELADENGRSIAAAFIDLDVLVLERLAGPPALGVVDVTRVEEQPLEPAPHPAL